MLSEHARALHTAIQTRPRPEDVAELVLAVLGGDATQREVAVIGKAARGSLLRRVFAYTSMAQDFWRPSTGIGRQVAVAGALFSRPPLTPEECLDAERVLSFVRELGEPISKTVGANDFRTDRLATKRARRAAGLYKNARSYNKRWRLLKRIEEKIARYAWNQRKYDYTRLGKSGLATRLTPEDLASDRNAACLAAYLAARMGLRSTFTNRPQQRPYDEVADVLFQRCESEPRTRWDVVARLMPDARVLQRLTPAQCGQLLGEWYAALTGMAEMLEKVYQAAPFSRLEMIVAQGNDSSTWNQIAGGWNQARAHWVSLLYALGADRLLDDVCPGKVMRLMAADVAAWHRVSGGAVHPDTRVWAELPPPWEVLRGRVRCGRDDVEAACRRVGVDPATWIEARGNRVAVPFEPTPELVHGVAVASPQLATILRRTGVFSGKNRRGGHVPDVHVEREEHGFARWATDAPHDDDGPSRRSTVIE